MVERKVLRKPLEPIDDDAACRSAYERLLEEYNLLNDSLPLQPQGDKEWMNATFRKIAERDGHLLLSDEEYCSRVEKYEENRVPFVRDFAAHLETVDMVRANVERYCVEVEKACAALDEQLPKLPDKEPQTEAEKEEFKRVWNESVCQKERELTHAHGDAMQRLQSELTKFPEVEQEFDWRRVSRR